MPQEPLTPAGVQNKVNELYALSDIELQAQVDTIRADFRSWLTDNFILDTGQQDYLNSMDDAFVDFTTCQVAFAVTHRLPITLDVEVSAVSKLVRTNSNLVGSHGTTGTSAEGYLSFEIIRPE